MLDRSLDHCPAGTAPLRPALARQVWGCQIAPLQGQAKGRGLACALAKLPQLGTRRCGRRWILDVGLRCWRGPPAPSVPDLDGEFPIQCRSFIFGRDLLPFFASLRETDGDGLFSTFNWPAWSAFGRAPLVAVHLALHFRTRAGGIFASLCHGHTLPSRTSTRRMTSRTPKPPDG